MGDVHDRVHVPGGCTVERGYEATTTPLWAAMAVEQTGRATWSSVYVPAPRPIQNRLLVCQKGKRRRKEGGIGRAMQRARGRRTSMPTMLAGREGDREGYIPYREPRQTPAAGCWLPVGGRRHPQGCLGRLVDAAAMIVAMLALALPYGPVRRAYMYGA